MRLWHKDLIESLPRQQLLSQWRECCCIARNIKVNGTPNHLLVNKILNYPLSHFATYSMLVANEMERRGYKVDLGKFTKYLCGSSYWTFVPYCDLFAGWHDKRYLTQCYHNLEEKYDCGGIPENEWENVVKGYYKNK